MHGKRLFQCRAREYVLNTGCGVDDLRLSTRARNDDRRNAFEVGVAAYLDLGPQVGDE